MIPATISPAACTHNTGTTPAAPPSTPASLISTSAGHSAGAASRSCGPHRRAGAQSPVPVGGKGTTSCVTSTGRAPAGRAEGSSTRAISGPSSFASAAPSAVTSSAVA